MNIACPVSLGELVDKVSILEIKKEKIDDREKLVFINEELNLLMGKLKNLSLDDIDLYLKEIKLINMELWEIEDDIRECERNNDFGDQFIKLAREVYKTNDKRFAIKNKINQNYGSLIREMKSYKEYE